MDGMNLKGSLDCRCKKVHNLIKISWQIRKSWICLPVECLAVVVKFMSMTNESSFLAKWLKMVAREGITHVIDFEASDAEDGMMTAEDWVLRVNG